MPNLKHRQQASKHSCGDDSTGSEVNPLTVLTVTPGPFLRLKLLSSALPPLDTSGLLNADRHMEHGTDHPAKNRTTESMVWSRAVHQLKTKVRLRGQPNNTEGDRTVSRFRHGSAITVASLHPEKA